MTHIRLKFPLGALPDPGPRWSTDVASVPMLARGAETLWNEQCAQYGKGMARLERIGRHSKARGEVRNALRFQARQVLASDRRAQQVAGFHRAMFPLAYVAPAHEVRGSVLTDRTVSDRRQDRFALDNAATAFLKAFDDDGQSWGTLDVTVRGHLQTIPDVVAYRGPARYRRPSPVRYGSQTERVWIAGETTIEGCVTLHRTTVIGRGVKFTGCHTSTGGPFVKITREGAHSVPLVKMDRWHGARELVKARGSKVARKASATARPTAATATSGRAVTWWTMAERSIPRRWATADVATIEAASLLAEILDSTRGGVPIELSDGSTVVVAAGHVDHEGRTFTTSSFARRAAMQGITAA